MQVLLLSLSPWPRPRLSSCISRRSRITSSWPGDINCEPRACDPPIPKQISGFGRRIPTPGPEGNTRRAVGPGAGRGLSEGPVSQKRKPEAPSGQGLHLRTGGRPGSSGWGPYLDWPLQGSKGAGTELPWTAHSSCCRGPRPGSWGRLCCD